MDLSSKIDKLSNRIDKLENKNIKLSSNDKPMFHSLTAAKQKEDTKKKEKIIPILDNTVELMVKEFKLHPPKEKVI